MAAPAETTRPTRRDATREAILEAALRCFGRDGFRRTALDRVAREAGISRAALYLHFANKEELFRALVEDLHARSLEDAIAASRADAPAVERLTGAICAKTARFFDLLRSSEHAQEFLDENHRLCGSISAAFALRHARLLARILASADAAGELSLAAAGVSAAQIAELLLDTAEGIKTRNLSVLSSAAYRKRLGDAVRLVLAGLVAPPQRRRASAARATPRGTR
ncbi:MAG TPA: helix-turn-helix domain-containing protein [Candidatus Limnocylindrales bacterium]|nr:helix-turn-helix domain-containing protein [Candidatus Limnocylindrales bacterium]